jgi:hypothetical protein
LFPVYFTSRVDDFIAASSITALHRLDLRDLPYHFSDIEGLLACVNYIVEEFRVQSSESRIIFRVDFPSCVVQPRSDAILGTYFGLAGKAGYGPLEGEVGNVYLSQRGRHTARPGETPS